MRKRQVPDVFELLCGRMYLDPADSLLKGLHLTYSHFLRSVILFSFLFPASVCGQPLRISDAGELYTAINKLSVLGSVLYIAAHPDDENTAVLSYSANGKLFRTAYLSITRGDGGQNLIGKEQSEMLGIIRTQELLAARRIDHSEQFFTRAIDFGYSKSPDETLALWNHDSVLADVVWVIRQFRPDVIITRFPSSGEGGHGHHTASAILAEEAFVAAGDPTKFTEQLHFVKPWKPKRLVWNGWGTLLERRAPLNTFVSVDVGDYNPLFGKSYTEIAAESRSMHKSQGFGATGQREETRHYFSHTAGDSARGGVFEGLNMTWSRIPDGEKLGKMVQRIAETFDPRTPEKSIPALVSVYRALRSIEDDYWIPVKKKELEDIIRSCLGLWIEGLSPAYEISSGSPVRIRAGIVNRSAFTAVLRAVRITEAQWDTTLSVNLTQGKMEAFDISIARLPSPVSQPYWLQKKSSKGLFHIEDKRLIGLPENPPSCTVIFSVEIEGERFDFTTPVMHRWTDPVHGEQYRPFVVAPAVTATFEDGVFLFSNEEKKDIHIVVKNTSGTTTGTIRLAIPDGWHCTPAVVPFAFETSGEEKLVRFTLQPTSKAASGSLRVECGVQRPDGSEETISPSYRVIDYSHIPKQTVFPPAEAQLVRLSTDKLVSRIGYIEGSGDEIPEYLRQLGYGVSLLSDKDIETGKLEQFDVIIAGVRAYNTRARLAQMQRRMMEYVANGGTYIVQYNTTQGLKTDKLGPYPMKLSRDRVTKEDAPMRFLVPEHPVMKHPNTITATDFDGWVQERGLYFASEWDEKYEALLGCNDPGEQEKAGSLLFTRHGRGVFIYTSLAFFRQLPAGVPGAFRLFINLISSGKNTGSK